MKLTEMSRYTNQLIREINTEVLMPEEVQYIKKKQTERREHLDKVISKRQVERLDEIKQD